MSRDQDNAEYYTLTLEDQNERLQAENARLKEELKAAQSARDSLANDALAALAATGTPTPEEGFLRSPYCLPDCIRRLAAERDTYKEDLMLCSEAQDAAERKWLALSEQLRQAQAGGWISVEERLPEEKRDVLIASGQRCRVGRWNHKTGDWRIEGNFYWPVRFWRELPPLPGEE